MCTFAEFRERAENTVFLQALEHLVHPVILFHSGMWQMMEDRQDSGKEKIETFLLNTATFCGREGNLVSESEANQREENNIRWFIIPSTVQ
jgi:hypothetical protein